jgi:two-component system chemotaxis response regulator CheB
MKTIGIASSTGGVEAIFKILQKFSLDCPPIILVQHITQDFTKIIANRLNVMCKINVKEAENDETLKVGTAYVAPSGLHAGVYVKNGLKIKLFEGKKLHGVIPSADVLFRSMAKTLGKESIGIILTGMGADGALGLLEMRLAGASTIGQNEETCVVYGMPKAAKDLNAVEFELPLDKIADKAIELSKV